MKIFNNEYTGVSMKNLTIGDLRNQIVNLPSNMEITFGSSKHSKRPLIFYRFKVRGDDLLHIELSELNPQDDKNISELDGRITVADLKKQLNEWKDTDRITFGSTIDAIDLIPSNPNVVFSFNLNQPDE
jgi:hypothetical protein